MKGLSNCIKKEYVGAVKDDQFEAITEYLLDKDMLMVYPDGRIVVMFIDKIVYKNIDEIFKYNKDNPVWE